MSELPRFKTPFRNPFTREGSIGGSDIESDDSNTPLPYQGGPRYSAAALIPEKERKPSVSQFHGNLAVETAKANRTILWGKLLMYTSIFLVGMLIGGAIGYFALPARYNSTTVSSSAATTTTSATEAAVTFDALAKAAKKKNNGVSTSTTSSASVAAAIRVTSSISTRASAAATTLSTRASSTAAATSARASATATSYWQPKTGSHLEIVLSSVITDISTIPSTVDVFETDMFDTPAATIAALKAAGKKVICYYSAGTAEDWRSDYSSFTSADLGAEMADWAGETWVDTRSANVRKIMATRMALAASKGCDGVEPDNVDVYNYGTASGFSGLTTATSIDYLTYLANTAHGLGLAIGLKNAGDIISSVVSLYQWSTTESCVTYNECSVYQPMASAGKPVFNIQYPFGSATTTTVKSSVIAKYCNGVSLITGMTSLLKHQSLDSWLYQC